MLPVLIGYALLTGGAASIWRATLAGTCLAAAWLWGRENDPLSLWSMALAVLLAIDPRQLFDLGFQLTFAATWGLIILAPALKNLFERNWKRSNLSDAMAFSLGAQFATLPVVAYHFGRISLAGFGANMLGVPLAGILVTTGMLGLLWAPATLLSYWLTRAVAAVATFAAQLPGAQWETRPLSLGWTVLCYLAFLLTASTLLFSHLDWSEIREAARQEISRWWQPRQHWWRNWHGSRGLLILVSLAALFLAVRVWQARNAPLRFTVLDVGQGEALLIRTPSGRTLLVDAGTTSTERGAVGRSVVVPYLQAAGVRRLDVMAVTHADADHCNALVDVMKEVPVGVLLDGVAGVPGQSTLETDYVAVRHQAQAQQIPVQAAQAGQTFDWGDGVRVQVLAPILPPLPGDNDNALVLRVEYGDVSFLLTADVEAAAEERLVRRGSKLRSTVLKVAHHGSRTSSSERFLQRVQPQIALISCGRYNSFGHPAPQTLEHLQRSGAAIYRTDLNGTVEVTCDKQSCWVQPFR